MTIIQFETVRLHRDISQLLGSEERVSGPRAMMCMLLAASTASIGIRMETRRLTDQYRSSGIISAKDAVMLHDLIDIVANSECGEAE